MKIRDKVLAVLLMGVIMTSFVGCADNSTNLRSAESVSESEDSKADATSSNSSASDVSMQDNTGAEDTSTATQVDTTEEEIAEEEVEEDGLQEDEISYGEYEDEFEDEIATLQKNSLNMLNYMTVMTERIKSSKGDQLYLETAYKSLNNDMYPNAVDQDTENQIKQLMKTIHRFQMIDEKRERIEFMYERSKAQAFRQAIPDPRALLSAVMSGDKLKMAASVIYMGIDSVSGYLAAKSQAELQYIQEGWQLDDEESEELHNSTLDALTYMYSMVRKYDLPGDLALNEEAVTTFVEWSSKTDDDLARKTEWFVSHEKTYAAFGPYWLELAKDYYNLGEYKKCLDSIKQYEIITSRILRKDSDYASTLPMVIASAREIMSDEEYAKTAERYCKLIFENTKDADWGLRYFAAQIYIDLYAVKNHPKYLNEAYSIARLNVIYLIDEQRKLNRVYMSDVVESTPRKDATKREKEEIKQYNKLITEERKTELPPISEPLLLNLELLFALEEKKDVSLEEKRTIDAILRGGEKRIFLSKVLDDRFWFENKPAPVNAGDIEVKFDNGRITLPALCVTDKTRINVIASGGGKQTAFYNWKVESVERPEGAKDSSDFIVTFYNDGAARHEYTDGDEVIIRMMPVSDYPEETLEFHFRATVDPGIAFGIGASTTFERVTE